MWPKPKAKARCCNSHPSPKFYNAIEFWFRKAVFFEVFLLLPDQHDGGINWKCKFSGLMPDLESSTGSRAQ